MYCKKCGYEINENTRFCPSCGEKISKAVDVNEVKDKEERENAGVNMEERQMLNTASHEIGQERSSDTQSDPIPKKKKNKLLYKIVGFIFIIFIFPNIVASIRDHLDYLEKRELYVALYDAAANRLEKEIDNVKVANYKRDRVAFQEYVYKDFGEGVLRYARYTVSVPAKWTAMIGEMDEVITTNVYYYTSNQHVSEGVDPSVEDHIIAESMWEDLRNYMDELNAEFGMTE